MSLSFLLAKNVRSQIREREGGGGGGRESRVKCMESVREGVGVKSP